MKMGRETWSVAIDALRANKLRAFLTMLGVVIGSACIVLVVTVSLTGRRYILQQIESVGSNLINAQAVHSPSAASALSYEMTLGDMDAIRQGIPNVTLVAGMRVMDMTVVVNGVEYPVSLIGVTQDYEEIRHLVIMRGRYFDSDDMAARNKVALITDNLAKRVFGTQNPVGLPVRLGELTFTVIGVFRERVATYGLSEIQTDSVLIPFSLMKYYTGDDYIRGLYVQMANPDDVAPATKRVEGLLLARHPPGSAFEVENLNGILNVAKQISSALTIVLSGDRADRSRGQWNRNHEHHARHGDGADARDRYPEGDWRAPPRNSLPIFARIIADQWSRRGSGCPRGRQHPRAGAAAAARKSARARAMVGGGGRAQRLVPDRYLVRIFAREQGRRVATHRILALRVEFFRRA